MNEKKLLEADGSPADGSPMELLSLENSTAQAPAEGVARVIAELPALIAIHFRGACVHGFRIVGMGRRLTLSENIYVHPR